MVSKSQKIYRFNDTIVAAIKETTTAVLPIDDNDPAAAESSANADAIEVTAVSSTDADDEVFLDDLRVVVVVPVVSSPAASRSANAASSTVVGAGVG